MYLENDEELPEIKPAAELDETAEYTSSRSKEEEDPILTAQRYLNIYHQIHIFKEKKKKEFDTSLLEMPDNIKDILPHLPGGRILLEHMVELEESNGIFDSYSKQLLETNPVTHSALHSSSKNENSSGSLSLSKDFAKELSESLAEALKENNAERPLAELGVLLKQLIQQTRTTPVKSTPIAGNTLLNRKVIKPSSVIAQQPNETNTDVVDNFNSNDEDDVDINLFLQAAKNHTVSDPTPEVPTIKETINPRTRTPLKFKNQLSEADIKAAEAMAMKDIKSESVQKPKQTFKPSKPTYSDALNKIKNAIDPTTTVSINNLDVKPVSLNPADSQKSDDEDWIYVDENGNPITDISGDEEWEYVDENGNPIKL